LEFLETILEILYIWPIYAALMKHYMMYRVITIPTQIF